MKTLLTVDWDAFVAEKTEWDLGHWESLLYLKFLWMSRMWLYDQIKTSGKEKDFWKKVPPGSGVTWVSDSHLFAFHLSHGVNRIVLVDGHHDCWPPSSSKKLIECHNWLRAWLQSGKKRMVTWVRPDWSAGVMEVPDDLKDRFEIVGLDDKLELGDVWNVHVCRSGCWTPPWLDKAFIDFVGCRGYPVARLQSGDWDPMKPRWNAKAERQALLFRDKIK